MSSSHRKILFKLEIDEDGYPPEDYESLWAEDLGNGTYMIDNVPFYVPKISWKDIVSADFENNELCFRGLSKASKHSTIRVIIYEESTTLRLRDQLEKLGCSSELSHVPNFIAVDIPPEVNFAKVRIFLDEGESNELWEYEESALRH